MLHKTRSLNILIHLKGKVFSQLFPLYLYSFFNLSSLLLQDRKTKLEGEEKKMECLNRLVNIVKNFFPPGLFADKIEL